MMENCSTGFEYYRQLVLDWLCLATVCEVSLVESYSYGLDIMVDPGSLSAVIGLMIGPYYCLISCMAYATGVNLTAVNESQNYHPIFVFDEL